MPKKGQSSFLCQECGYESPQWMGFCPSCGGRSPLVEAPISRPASNSWLNLPHQKPAELSTVSLDNTPRYMLPYREVNRVLGGGLVPGSVILLAGDPGIGKSTLLLQLADALAQANKVLYISGEESSQQIKLRAQRLSISGRGLYFLGETRVEEVLYRLQEMRPSFVIVDSIQTMATEGVSSAPGSVVQVRESTRLLMQWAKAEGVPLLLVGHVTKEGELAGPRVLEHMVDVVIYLEGEPQSGLRILRGVKNRFGSTNEVALLQMEDKGLVEVVDPSRHLLAERDKGAEGSAIVPVIEGTRPLLIEVQALALPSGLAIPRRVSNGVDQNRLVMLAAVLSRHSGISLASQDIFVNVAGGLRITEPAADLAVDLAIVSSIKKQPIISDLIVVGEVGLGGELRRVSQIERRLKEATRLGFTQCLLPISAREEIAGIEGMKPRFASNLSQALDLGLR